MSAEAASAISGLPVPGWFGKLPSLGDFAQRRLAPDFVEAWDHWLAAELAGWQQRQPEDWLARYLAGPSWRFLLLPGAVPGLEAALGGVLMPSVDRVGRYFPLTLGWPCAVPGSVRALRQLFSQLHELDDLALDALQGDWPAEQLEQALEDWAARQPAPPDDGSPAPARAHAPVLPEAGRLQPLAPADDAATGFADAALAAHLAGHAGGVLWWSEVPPARPRSMLGRGLPADDDFLALFELPPAPGAA